MADSSHTCQKTGATMWLVRMIIKCSTGTAMPVEQKRRYDARKCSEMYLRLHQRGCSNKKRVPFQARRGRWVGEFGVVVWARSARGPAASHLQKRSFTTREPRAAERFEKRGVVTTSARTSTRLTTCVPNVLRNSKTCRRNEPRVGQSELARLVVTTVALSFRDGPLKTWTSRPGHPHTVAFRPTRT